MNQPTYEEHTERCKQKVWPSGQFTSHRCSRKSVKDGYCNQHHPDTVKARDEKHRAEYEHKRALHPLTLANKQIEELKQQRDDYKIKADKYDALNTPEIHDFLKAIENEALHQRDRWSAEHDAGKTDADWFWLIGYLAGKAIHKPEKSLHHIITTAAACLNWHAAKLGTHNGMRPGIEVTK